jgi:CRP-like cAMP-binding protein
MYGNKPPLITDEEYRKGISVIWSLLHEEEKDMVRQNTIKRSFERGEYIYHIDTLPMHIMFVLTGNVKLERIGAGQRPQIVRMLLPGQAFGYRSYYAKQRRQTQAIATEETSILAVDLKTFDELIRRNGNVAMYVIHRLALRLGEIDMRSVNLQQKHLRGRLADSLIFLKDKYGFEEDGLTLNIYLSREELASLSNMTTNNAIRTLSAFAEEGLVILDGRRIKITNLEALRKINSCG